MLCPTVKDESDASCHRRPTTLDVHTADIEPTSSSLVSVADHVEHLTDTAMGSSLSFNVLLLHCVLSRQFIPNLCVCISLVQQL